MVNDNLFIFYTQYHHFDGIRLAVYFIFLWKSCNQFLSLAVLSGQVAHQNI